MATGFSVWSEDLVYILQLSPAWEISSINKQFLFQVWFGMIFKTSPCPTQASSIEPCSRGGIQIFSHSADTPIRTNSVIASLFSSIF
jgi:hypothetical protein